MAKNISEPKTWKFTPLAYSFPLVMALVFVYLTYSTPASSDSSLLIRFSILIPEIIIWLLATLTAVRFKQYVMSIKNSPDGESLNYIANALLLLVVYVILLTSADAFVRLFINTNFLESATVLGHHIPIAVAAVSGVYLFYGSQKLKQIAPAKIWTRTRGALFAVLCFALFGIFAWQFYQAAPTLESVDGVPRFVLPVSVLLFTYVLPHVVLWVLGLLACINLAQYAAKVNGAIYKELFHNLYQGILLVFICIFISQFLIISSVVLSEFTFLLAVIYGVLILGTLGFVLIFRGVKQLEKIEG